MGIGHRRFVASGLAACACAGCPALRVLAEAAAAGGGGAAPVDVGVVDDFKDDGIYAPRAAGGRFFLVRRGGRLYALSSTCTHRQVRVVAKGGGFKCPRHGSTFSSDGKVTKAPARKPLPRYAIQLDVHGRVMVDPSVSFGPDAWDDARAFIAVTKRSNP